MVTSVTRGDNGPTFSFDPRRETTTYLPDHIRDAAQWRIALAGVPDPWKRSVGR